MDLLNAVLEFVFALAMSLSYGFMITFLVLWGRAMPEHAYFMLLFVALFTTIIATTMFFLRKLFYVASGFEDFQQLHRAINRTYLKFPIPQLIGFMLMINYVLAGFGSPHVSGILQAVLTQGSIPFTIVMSYLLLKRRYVWLQLLGATVVIGGALLSMEKDFSGGCSPENNSSNITVGDFKYHCFAVNQTLEAKNVSSYCVGSSNSVFWDFLYFISTMPIGLVNIINEYFLQYSKNNDTRRAKVGELNIPFAVAVTNLWLFIWLVLFFWLNLLPTVVPQCMDVPRNLHIFGENMRVAMKCTFSKTGGFSYNGSEVNTTDLHYTDDCDNAIAYVMALALAATIQMILQAYTVQQQSATFTMALVTLGPIFAVFFQNSHLITGHYYDQVHTEFSNFMTAGLIIVLLGIIMYKVPGILRHFNALPALHPIETDDSESFIHKKLSFVLRRFERSELQKNKGTDVQGLIESTGSDDAGDVAGGCC